MKQISSLLILLAASTLNAQVIPDMTTKKLGYTGDVKQVEEYIYTLNYKTLEFQYNSAKTFVIENKVLIKETEDFKGAFPSVTISDYIYNANGLLLKKSTAYTSNNQTKNSQETYTYEQGILIKSSIEKSSYSNFIEYSYDSKGKILKSITKNGAGLKFEVQDFYNVTDSKNYNVKISNYNVKDQTTPYSVKTNVYKNGLLISSNTENTNEHTDYQYDSQGNLIQSTSSNSNSTTNIYEYDKSGNWICRKASSFSSMTNSYTDIYTFRRITYSDNSLSGNTDFNYAFYDKNPSQVKNTDFTKVEKTYVVLNKSGDCENGYGTIKYPNGEKYEGFFKNGKRNGPGRYDWSNGNYYIGNWLDDKKEDYGYLNMGNGTEYFGYFHNDKFNENGVYRETYFLYQGYYTVDGVLKTTYVLGDNNVTTGCVQGNCINGFGKYMYSNDSYFIGFFKEGEIQHGVYVYPKSEKYIGEFSENKKEGFGMYLYESKNMFYGYYLNDYHAGLGVFKDHLFEEKNLIGEFDDRQLIKNYNTK